MNVQIYEEKSIRENNNAPHTTNNATQRAPSLPTNNSTTAPKASIHQAPKSTQKKSPSGIGIHHPHLGAQTSTA